MSSASDTTARRKQRILFADKIIQQQSLENNLRIRIKLEGGGSLGAMSYSAFYHEFKDGTTVTTVDEKQSYIESVPRLIPEQILMIPDAPTSVTATRGNAQAIVSFTAPANNGGAPITSYTVNASPGGATSTGVSSPITISGLTNGTAYTFTVVAINSVGNSSPSIASAAVTPATTPAAPTSLSATVSTTQISITFSAGANGGSSITNYEYSINGGISFTTLSPAISSSPITITGLTANTTYSVQIKAVNDLGSGVASSSLSVTTSASLPSAPTLSTTLADDGAAYIYFYNADAGATNYAYSINNGASFTTLSPVSITSPIKITGLSNGITYTVKLRTLRGADESVDSNSLTVTPVNPSVASPYLYYDPSNSSSYSGVGTSISNLGSYGAHTGSMSASVSYVSSVASGVLDFNGGYGVMISLPSINLGNTISVIGWVYPRSLANINGLFTNAGANVPTNGFKFQWNFWLSSSRAISFQAGNGSEGGDDHTPLNTLSYDTWQHFAYVFDKANRRIIMFFNGIPTIMSTDTITVANINTNGAAYIGGYAGGSYTMNARLGYLKVFNSLLDATQVYADYNSSRSRFGV